MIELIASEPLAGNGAGRREQILWGLGQIRNQTAMLTRHREIITWLETDNTENRLCAIPKDLDERLYADIWSKGIPVILTSGTLSANGDFSHTKRTLGLNSMDYHDIK